jgi:hypothetical protein
MSKTQIDALYRDQRDLERHFRGNCQQRERYQTIDEATGLC